MRLRERDGVREDGTRVNERTNLGRFCHRSGASRPQLHLSKRRGGNVPVPDRLVYAGAGLGMRLGHQGFDRPITGTYVLSQRLSHLAAGATITSGHSIFSGRMADGGCSNPRSGTCPPWPVAEENDPAQVRDAIVNPARLSPSLARRRLSARLRQPSSVRTSFVRKPGQTDYGYQPGQPLSDYLAYLELDDGSIIIPTGSARYRQSDGELSCLTCHDPHGKVAEGQRAAHYSPRTK